MGFWLRVATRLVGIGTPLLCACSPDSSGTGSSNPTRSQLSRIANEQKIVDRNYEKCIDKSGGITFNLMSCGGIAIDRYQSIIDEISSIKNAAASLGEIKKFSASQEAWIGTAEKTCEVDPDFRNGGTLAAITFNACIVDAFDHRISELIGARE